MKELRVDGDLSSWSSVVLQRLPRKHSEAQQLVRSLPALPVARPPLPPVYRLGGLLSIRHTRAAAQGLLPHGGDSLR